MTAQQHRTSSPRPDAMPDALQASMTQGASEVVAGTDPVGLPSLGTLVTSVTGTVGRSADAAREAAQLAREMLRIVRGSSTVAPEKGDWRFADPAWQGNPIYRRLGQTYLAASRSVDRLVDGAEASGRSTEKIRFVMNGVVSAAAPTNTLLGNPAALKKAFDTGGASVVRGVRHWVDDLRHNGGLPSMSKPGVLEVGRDMAVTPGSVIDRDEFAEVIQYTPTTEMVRERPLLVVPPPIGRYYFLDLRPGRSFVEYCVSRGLQVHMLSWRNPTAKQGDWELEHYARRILSAIDVLREATGSDDVNVIGFCAGGLMTAATLVHLAEHGDTRVHSAAFAVTLLDFSQPAPIGAFSSPRLLSLARFNSRRAGIISARAMGAVFTWMRPNDLVWNYWVNNYLLGEEPPVFDVLAWNADGTNLPQALHQQFLDIFERNVLCKGEMTVLGSRVDLSTIKVPTYVAGAVNDHLTPWRGTYRTTQLVGGESTFVLSNAGHIASLVNPPGNPKAGYYTDGQSVSDPDKWLGTAEKHTGSWWEHYAEWVLRRSGEDKPASRSRGSDAHPPLDDAPGRYVRS